MSLNLYTTVAITTSSMGAKDVIGTLMMVSEAKGRQALSGMWNAINTPLNLIFYSFAGANLLHNYGYKGWLSMGAIMCVDFTSTYFATGWSKKIKAANPTPAMQVPRR